MGMAVEEAQIETAKTSETLMHFPPHTRRHLNSQTYRTLVRILSRCSDESPPSLPAHNVDHDPKSENGSNELGQITEKRVAQHIELICNDSTEPKVSEKVMEVNLNVGDDAFRDRELGEQMAIDQIDQLMILDENEDLSNQKDVSGFQEPGFGSALMLINELENIVKGNENIFHENNSKPSMVPFVQDRSIIDQVPFSNHQKEQADFKQIDINFSGNVSEKVLPSLLNTEVLDAGIVREQQKDSEPDSVSAVDSNNSIPIIEFGKTERREGHSQKSSEDLSFSPGRSRVANTSDASDKSNDQISLETNALKVSFKDTQLEKPVCYGNVGDSANHKIEDVDVEEGEISGGYCTDDISMDMPLQDTGILEGKKVNEDPIADKQELSRNIASEIDFGSTFFLLDNNDGVGLRESDKNKTVGTLDIVVNKKALRASKVDASDDVLEAQKFEANGGHGNDKVVLHGQSLEEDGTRHHNISTEKHDAEVRVKKRSQPSKEKKAKKKQKKRAEKNRQLGVKRLRLPPISKPKTVSYCRHFLMGRCQEGDQCKFSHDTVPLTKFKPCCHFARHACMKGDDCPFDHQLSKYPCSNFVSKGFCSRGDSCMFSHKIAPKEDATTTLNAVEPEKKHASLMCNSFKKQLNDSGASGYPFNILSCSTGISSHKNTEKNTNETVTKQAKMVPKGTSFLSFGSLPLVDSNRLKQQNLSPNSIADAKVGNHIQQHGSGMVQNANEIPAAPKGTNPPVVAPKGINFLSFGRVQQNDLSSRRLSSSPSSRDSGAKLSPSDNLSMRSQTSSAPDSTTSSAPDSNSTLNGTQPAVAPKGLNFLSFGKSSLDDSCNKGRVEFPFNWDNVTGISGKERKYPLDGHQYSSSTPSKLPSSSVSLVQSPNPSSSRIHKDTAQSAQKALLSTLAFAAKYESGMRLNQSIHDPSVGTEIDKEAKNNGLTGGVQNGLEKVSRIFELLSCIRNKGKQ
ncbi:Zinc finger, CCCH-type [Parasponia andersonii]|uniref:Zinc finger, CCCH-type n=1 Tax=Parasponia andersonii TaxID=3476 RepID=A0A2P5BDH4_PARAD|nr:Zinc finger, CCCH-type [Parasponia andersonii]